MTKEETVAIIAMIKVAYPHYYKDINDDKERKPLYSLWYNQFCDLPYELVLQAVNAYIAYGKYPPTIADIAEQLQYTYDRVYEMKQSHLRQLKENREWNDIPEQFKPEKPYKVGIILSEEQLAYVEEILRLFANREHRINEIAWNEQQKKLTGGNK
jgi:hypothetical protein